MKEGKLHYVRYCFTLSFFLTLIHLDKSFVAMNLAGTSRHFIRGTTVSAG